MFVTFDAEPALPVAVPVHSQTTQDCDGLVGCVATVHVIARVEIRNANTRLVPFAAGPLSWLRVIELSCSVSLEPTDRFKVPPKIVGKRPLNIDAAAASAAATYQCHQGISALRRTRGDLNAQRHEVAKSYNLLNCSSRSISAHTGLATSVYSFWGLNVELRRPSVTP